MADYEQRLLALSPEQRKLLEHRLKQKAQLSAQAPKTEQKEMGQIPQIEAISEREKGVCLTTSSAQVKPLQFSIIFFSEDKAQPDQEPYDLVLQTARYADQQGFSAVWLPERHLHRFGGQYPNPSVLGAALAMITRRIEIRAGSVVLPLHHPLRVVEEWSMVDNLSHGRVGLSFASGWIPNDFILAREAFEQRRSTLYASLDLFKKLWKGETVQFLTPEGISVDAQAFPRPVRLDIPLWITSSGSVDTWRRAGEIGANVLTALLQQSVEEVAEKIALYRAVRTQHGHDPEAGVVTLMLHTFIWDDYDVVYQKVHNPLLAYIQSHMDVYRHIARITGRERDAERFTLDDQAVLAEHAFTRYFNNNGLFGTPASCQAMLRRLQSIGVDEIACLIDFGIDPQTVLHSLQYMQKAQEYYQKDEKR